MSQDATACRPNPNATRQQDRTTGYLLLNNALGAATGLLFWLLLVRVARLPPDQVGIGYALVALGTTVGLLSKGGLDTALLRHVPEASAAQARRLLGTSLLVGLAVTSGVIAVAWQVAPQAVAGNAAWLWIAMIAALLLASWLQDAFFLAHGDPRAAFHRNLAFSAGKVLLPVPLVLLAFPHPVAASWALALGAGCLVGLLLVMRQPAAATGQADSGAFFRSARRNVAGNLAEFLPGLILVPVVLHTQGASAAGYFGIAWTGASLLFLVAAAIGRSALSRLVRERGQGPAAIRRATAQATAVLVPGILAASVLARPALAIFGQDYAAQAAPAFLVLVASTVLVAPTYLYLSWLRATEHAQALLWFPVAMVCLLVVLAPAMGARFGLAGTAAAWLLANLPFGLWSTWRLWGLATEVRHDAQTFRGGADVERA